MRLRMDRFLVFLAAAAAMAGFPSAGRGQPASAGRTDLPARDSSVPLRLEALARALVDRGREGWARAADLYGRAAELRGPADPRAAEDLVVAGHLFHYAGDHERSVLAFRRAGALLLTWGRLEAAAGAFRDGAWVAHRAGLERDAEELSAWSEVLLRSHDQERQAQRRLATGAGRSS